MTICLSMTSPVPKVQLFMMKKLCKDYVPTRPGPYVRLYRRLLIGAA